MNANRIDEALDEMGWRRLQLAREVNHALTAADDGDLVTAVGAARIADLELDALLDCVARWSVLLPEIESALKGQVREDWEASHSMWLAVYGRLAAASMRGEP